MKLFKVIIGSELLEYYVFSDGYQEAMILFLDFHIVDCREVNINAR